MRCLNIIVYYDNPEEIKKYINDCVSNSSNVDIAVVINSDNSGMAEDVIESISSKRIKIYDFNENIGYLNSLLKVVQLENLNDYQYYILSNTDILYETPGFFEKLASKQYASDVGCIAPSVLSVNTGSFANPHYKNRTSKKKFKMLSFIFSNPLVGRMYLFLSGLKARAHSTCMEEKSCYVYSPHGCYMIFTREFVQDILGYLYGVTLYSEEACVGELLLKNGKKCYFDNSLRVHHLESTVTGKIDYKKRFKYWKQSIDYILKEFY